MRIPVLLLLAVAAIPSCLAAATGGLRGNGTGVFPEATPPLTWSADANVVWKVPAGRSAATPLVLADRVVVMADPDMVVAYARADGKELWRTTLDAAAITVGGKTLGKPKKPHKVVGHTCPSPVAVEGGFVCLLNSGILARVGDDGTVAWATAVAPVTQGYGQSMSPAVAGGTVAVHIDDTLYGIDLASGEGRWQQPETQHQGSPVGIDAGGVPVFLGTHGGVFAAADGAVITRLGFPALNKFNTPVPADGSWWWISEGKFLVKATFTATGGTVKVAKSHSGIERGVYYASVLVHDGLAYGYDHQKKERILKVLDLAAKGKQVARRVVAVPGAAYPSPALAGGFLYVFGAKGTAEVLHPTWKDGAVDLAPVARNELGEELFASPVFAGKSLFLRGTKQLWRIDASAEDLARAKELRGR